MGGTFATDDSYLKDSPANKMLASTPISLKNHSSWIKRDLRAQGLKISSRLRGWFRQGPR